MTIFWRVGLTIRELITSNKCTEFTRSGTRIPAESFKEFKEMINKNDENWPGTAVETAKQYKNIEKILKKLKKWKKRFFELTKKISWLINFKQKKVNQKI